MTIFVTIFVASLIGSLHCAGMCGAFVAIATGSIDASPRQKLITQIAYNGGRLLTYVTMGAIAGTVGAFVDLAGRLAGIQTAATLLAGGVMVGFGVVSLMRIMGWQGRWIRLPKAWHGFVGSMHRRSMRYEPTTRALLIGLSTTLLPCGWLYAFVVTAAATGHPVWGALAMVAFWFGTLPVMVSLGVGVQTLLGRFGPKVPALTCLLLIGVGLYTLIGRGMMDGIAIAGHTVASTQPTEEIPACCQPQE
jgi:sulfite exporter TauE/SafE